MKCKNILEAIGQTPLVRLNRLTKDLQCEVYVKLDYMNPGGSVKDRIGITMIDEAERKGLLKPGGTIIEGTSGNTGMGLALVCVGRGYKMVLDRKSTRLNSSHLVISYAVFCLKKKK